jgi:hypothetical protein
MEQCPRHTKARAVGIDAWPTRRDTPQDGAACSEKMPLPNPDKASRVRGRWSDMLTTPKSCTYRATSDAPGERRSLRRRVRGRALPNAVRRTPESDIGDISCAG